MCKKNVAWEGNPFRPFCSERCKLVDLDNWLEGRYRAGTRHPDFAGSDFTPDLVHRDIGLRKRKTGSVTLREETGKVNDVLSNPRGDRD
jgi:endogenous inhibitor of DNA gyrase (YacG/DUF329 family)